MAGSWQRSFERCAMVTPPDDSPTMSNERWLWWKRALAKARWDLVLSGIIIACVLIGAAIGVWSWPLWLVLVAAIAQAIVAVVLAGKRIDRQERRAERDRHREQFQADFDQRYNPERWPDHTESPS